MFDIRKNFLALRLPHLPKCSAAIRQLSCEIVELWRISEEVLEENIYQK